MTNFVARTYFSLVVFILVRIEFNFVAQCKMNICTLLAYAFMLKYIQRLTVKSDGYK